MFKGSMVALVTPMEADGTVDHGALERLVEFHIEAGTDAIIAVGTTGESATLDESEHCAVVERIIKRVKGRIPVIAGTGANSTREALALTRRAAELGADGCLLVTPYYNKPTQEGLYQHYKTIAEAVQIPQILYNVPGRTACDLLPETVERLSSVDNIVAIKEASAEVVERVADIVARCGKDFSVFSGDDGMALDAMLAGAQGVISVTANIAPDLMHEMCALALAGDEAGARKVDKLLAGLHSGLFLESNPIPAKWLLSDMDMIPSGIRLPLTPLAAEYHEALRGALAQARA